MFDQGQGYTQEHYNNKHNELTTSVTVIVMADGRASWASEKSSTSAASGIMIGSLARKEGAAAEEPDLALFGGECRLIWGKNVPSVKCEGVDTIWREYLAIFWEKWGCFEIKMGRFCQDGWIL